MSPLTALRKSSPSPLISRIPRLQNRPFFNQPVPEPQSSSSSSTLGSCTSTINQENIKNSDRSFFLKSLSGVLVGSGLGFLLWTCSSSSSICYADNNVAAIEDVSDRSSSLREVEHEAKKPTRYIFGESYRRKIFFNYEKRLRMRSPPEKVFEYFASHENPEGVAFMTPADLMRAVVPVFPPSESHLVREGHLKGERNPGELQCAPSKFFMLFDINNDGLISFAEYIFFVTLLSIPESSFYVAFKMFDLDNNGEIDREEFKKVMAVMRSHNREGAHNRDGLRTGLKVENSVENGGILEFFFGKDGKSCLQHTRFIEFLKDLHDEILLLEFAHYDYKQRGTLSAKDFALSMVASADMSHISKFLHRVDEINTDPHLRGARITLEEFMAFAELRRQVQPFSMAIFSYEKIKGVLTKKDFQRAASNVCGISLTDNVVDIIYHVFDMNRDGSLSAHEFVKVLHMREKDISQPATEGIIGSILCWLKGSKNSSFIQSIF